jgi:hypothetical protein
MPTAADHPQPDPHEEGFAFVVMLAKLGAEAAGRLDDAPVCRPLNAA